MTERPQQWWKSDTPTGTETYDGIALTLPNHLVASCLELTDPNYRQMLGRVQYLGLVCVVLVLRQARLAHIT